MVFFAGYIFRYISSFKEEKHFVFFGLIKYCPTCIFDFHYTKIKYLQKIMIPNIPPPNPPDPPPIPPIPPPPPYIGG